MENIYIFTESKLKERDSEVAAYLAAPLPKPIHFKTDKEIEEYIPLPSESMEECAKEQYETCLRRRAAYKQAQADLISQIK